MISLNWLAAVPLMLPGVALAAPAEAPGLSQRPSCYIGVTGGYVVSGRSYKTNSVNVGGSIFPAQTNDFGLRGPAGGADIGCDIRPMIGARPSRLVFGPELEGWFQNVHGRSDVANLRSPGETIRSFAKSTFAGAASLRLGYSFRNLLLYGKGGAALTTFKHHGYIFDNASGATVDVTSNSNRTSLGYLAGAGAEVTLSRHWSAKLEYNYVNFGSVNTIYQIDLDPGQPTAAVLTGPSKGSEDEHFLKVGAAYHF